jgi:hypothetical protein
MTTNAVAVNTTDGLSSSMPDSLSFQYHEPQPMAKGQEDNDGYRAGFTGVHSLQEIERKKSGWFAYMKTRDFYVVLVLG